MIIYFCIYCFLGYLMESLYVSLLQRKWISSGLMKGPYIPLYGFGALILILLSPFLQASMFLSFLFGGIAMTIVELISSYYIEKVFHTKCWDYSKHFLHYHGRICILYFIIWCILSLVFIQYIHPFMISLNLINDTNTVIALIYLAAILKSFIEKLNPKKINGFDIP